ncbi:hCG1990684 [Homo sapiens]|uniref:Putative uncharacterized protein encoded by LINC00208 n=1 Tax=Homo sapiens TaxID=9606 RepID=CH014_HUMAN|nr:RecName: Full=Putative uncharacterized protein encoded by LINC00208 [Homo sapiens]EAW65619.1 hCG1990684 [Homo sapiens]CAC82745.1 hypothetical protein [Homo sapiens]
MGQSLQEGRKQGRLLPAPSAHFLKHAHLASPSEVGGEPEIGSLCASHVLHMSPLYSVNLQVSPGSLTFHSLSLRSTSTRLQPQSTYIVGPLC